MKRFLLHISLRIQRTFSVVIFVCVLFCGQAIAQKKLSSETDLKKQAEKQFDTDNYAGAMPLYSQLLSLYPKNPAYNYRYGVCLLLSSKDRSGSVSYLEMASMNRDVETEVYFYLGKSYMVVNNFNSAIIAFDNFKKHASNNKIKKLNVDLLISNCRNAKELSKTRRNVVIVNQQQVIRNSFYTTYDFDSASGKILTTSESFLSSEDKKRVADPSMFLTDNGQTIYYASYGKNSDKGKDIYRVSKLADGKWGTPENLGIVINTLADEDFPYLDHDGITLYFSSKGHNSMGGYDIYKSVFDRNSWQWSAPENAGIPINTPDDDVLYVPNHKGDCAQYASAIESDQGKIGVRKIKLGDVLNEQAVINGQFFSVDQPQRRDAKISVIRMKDNGLVTSVRTDPRNGSYAVELPPGEDYTLVIEAGGYLPHAENFSIPEGLNFISLKQEIKLDKTVDVEKMTLSNYFTVASKTAENIPATVSNEPSNVISNEYHLNDSERTKMRPIDIKGRTVYVVPPRNIMETKSGSGIYASYEKTAPASLAVVQDKSEPEKVGKQVAADRGSTDQKKADASADEIKEDQPMASNLSGQQEKNSKKENQKKDKSKSEAREKKRKDKQGVKNNGNALAQSQPASDESRGKTEKIEEEKLKSETQEKIKDEKNSIRNIPSASVDKKSDDQVTQPVSVYTTNEQEKNVNQSIVEPNKVKAGEQVISKNATEEKPLKVIHDEKSADTDPEVMAKTAEVAKKIAVEQDSISKTQIKTAKELLLTGGLENKEKAKALFKESEDIKKQSDARISKANYLETQANLNTVKADPSLSSKEIFKSIENGTAASSTSLSGKIAAKQPAVSSDDAKKESNSTNHAEADLIETASVIEKKVPVSAEKSTHENKTIDKPKEKAVSEQKQGVKPVELEKVKPTTISDSNLKSGGESFSSSTLTEKTDSKNNSDHSGYGADLGSIDKIPSQSEKQSTKKETIPINEAAKESYVQHAQMMNESKEMSKISADIENKIIEMPASPKRDSLLALSNDLNLRSIKKWQEAEQKLNEAKKQDPAVEAKVKTEEKHEQDNSKQEIVVNAPVKENKLVQNSSFKHDALAVNTNEKQENPVTPTANTVNRIDEDNTETQVDVNSPVYPEYIDTKEKIKAKQTETINVFAEGVKLNRLAQQKKEEEITIRKKANQESDLGKKILVQKQADVLKQKVDSLDVLSQQKFRTAQLNTGEVVILNHQASRLKAEMNNPGSASLDKQSIPKTEPAVQTSTAVNKSALVDELALKESASVNTEKKSVKSELNLKTNNSSTPVHEQKKAEEDNASHELVLEKITSSPANTRVNDIAKQEQLKSSPANSSKNSDLASTTNKNEKAEALKFPVKKILADATGSYEKITIPVTSNITSHSNETIFSFSSNPVADLSKVIPMNPSLPSGLVFKVQIGAFHAPLPENIFKNIQPVTGETTRPGWIRYCVGLFQTFESANLVKSGVKNMGYKDAFVVAYYNGKRIGMNEAYALLNKSGVAEKKQYASTASIEMAHVRSLKMDLAANEVKAVDMNSVYMNTSSSSSHGADGIEYAVQVGVYKTSNVPKALVSLMPLQTEPMVKGLYRFLTPRYSQIESANASKKSAVSNGVKDAFIIAYKNGNKIALRSVNTATQEINTAWNSVKPNDESIRKEKMITSVFYKVQLGAYRQKISEQKMNEIKKMSPDAISQEVTASGLQIYYSGLFSDVKSALSSKRIIVSNGIKDAFVVAFQNGKKISLAQVSSSMVKNN